MGSVGLLYVGAVLILNGLMLVGIVEAKSAIPLNIMVGLLQVFTPTYLIVSADGNQLQILGASGLYLFGFTYLYVAANNYFDLDGSALGWFSGFVAVCAIVFAALNFWYQPDGVAFGDVAFGIIWLHWAFLWGLFFAILGLGYESLGRFTGIVAVVQGWMTGFAPAFLLMTGSWAGNVNVWTLLLTVGAIVAYGLGYVMIRRLPAVST